MDRSDIDEDPEEINNTEEEKKEEGSNFTPNLPSQLDFYQDDPFTHCKTDGAYGIWGSKGNTLIHISGLVFSYFLTKALVNY